MKSCFNCKSGHIAKDFEFDIVSSGISRYSVPENFRHDPSHPIGKCFMNIDMLWCDNPDDKANNFSVISFKPFNQKFCEFMAENCNNYKEM